MLDGALDDLLALLDLEAVEHDAYLGQSPAGRDRRVYGGQLLAQALIAAQRSTDAALVTRSLHAYFVHPGDPVTPILYQVTTTPVAAGSFACVRAMQHDRTLCVLDAVLSASYVPAPSPAPRIGSPDDAPTQAETIELMRRRGMLPNGDWFTRPRPFERRYVEDIWKREGVPPRHSTWFRGIGAAPDDERMNQALALYFSDDTIMDNALLPYGGMLAWADFNSTSLDHAMWFHRPFRVDDWHLFVQDSPVAGGGRGFTRGVMWNRDGLAVATATQEILMRRRRD
jgi:acyl-CoA thioesterase-2